MKITRRNKNPSVGRFCANNLSIDDAVGDDSRFVHSSGCSLMASANILFSELTEDVHSFGASSELLPIMVPSSQLLLSNVLTDVPESSFLVRLNGNLGSCILSDETSISES